MLLLGCSQDSLRDQAHREALEPSTWFEDGASARPRIPGTVAHGHMREAFVAPAEPSRADLDSGRRDYDTYCVPCHGRLGDGDGMVVRQGYPGPEPLASARLRALSDAELMQVIAGGKGDMFGYAAVLDPLARWRVAQWIRVLQLSAHAPLARLDHHDRAELREASHRTP